MNKKKWMLIVACVVVLAAIVYALTGGKKEAPVMDYETARVEKATIGNSVTATGTIEPVTKVEVGTQVSGIIDKIYVDYNSVVHKGQIIAELDKTNLMSELNSAKSNLAGAKSDLDYQRANYKRIKALYDKELVSGNEYDTALLSLRQAESTYAQRKEAVSKAQTNLGYAIITSPIDGIIISKAVEEGQTVAASYSTPTLFTIAQDLTDMRVIADVDEADIGEVDFCLQQRFETQTWTDGKRHYFHSGAQQHRERADKGAALHADKGNAESRGENRRLPGRSQGVGA